MEDFSFRLGECSSAIIHTRSDNESECMNTYIELFLAAVVNFNHERDTYMYCSVSPGLKCWVVTIYPLAAAAGLFSGWCCWKIEDFITPPLKCNELWRSLDAGLLSGRKIKFTWVLPGL
jgi:hypothetical protein